MLSELWQCKLDNQFRLLDTDGDGLIRRADYLEVAGRLCADRGLDPAGDPGRELSARHAALFDRFCPDPEGELSAQRFLCLMAASLEAEGGLKGVLRPMVRTILEVCDSGGDGELGRSDFRAFLGAWGLPASDADAAFEHLDIDLSGQISYEELADALEEFYGSDDPHAPGNWLFGPVQVSSGPRARLPYPDPAELSPAARELLASMPPLELFQAMAHAQTVFPSLIGMGKAVYTELELPGALRELAVLQVAQELDAAYVWTQHVSAAQAEQTPRTKIIAVRDGRLDAACLTDAEQASLAFTAEVLRRNRASDATFDRLRGHLPPRQIVELLIVIGWYAMVARITTALALDSERAQGDKVIAYSQDQ